MAAPTITTPRLTLRALTEDDHTNISYLLKPEIERFSTSYMPHNAKDLKTYITKINNNTTWGILKDAVLIGDISVSPDIEDEVGDIAWYIDPVYWKNGYGFEASQAVIDHLFNKVGYTRLNAQISTKNTASINLALKLGFKQTLIIPDSDFCDDGIGYYSLATLPCLY